MIRNVTLLASLLFTILAVSDCAAQWRPYAIQPVRSLDRWLGVGYGNGYHWRTPGTDVGYYDAFSGANLPASAITARAGDAPWAWPKGESIAARSATPFPQPQPNSLANMTRQVGHQDQPGPALPSVLLAPVSEFQPMPKSSLEQTRFRSPFSR